MKLRPEQIAPLALIVLDVISTVGYAISGDVRKAIYWAASAVLTVVVTF